MRRDRHSVDSAGGRGNVIDYVLGQQVADTSR